MILLPKENGIVGQRAGPLLPTEHGDFDRKPMSKTVLVTGAFGLVGSATVKRLAADGRRVVATDFGTPAHRKAAPALPAGACARWADLTDPAAVNRLISEVSPTAIVHLAAVIPPLIYRDANLARKVNVDATAALVRSAAGQPNPPRFVQASSNAVYGPRNPHRLTDLEYADTAPKPYDLYGATKLGAEEQVHSSNLEWVVLRLGGVFSVDLTAMPVSSVGVFFESALPTDGRVHTVDVRDVAAAFAAATTADVAGETLLVAGDDSHLLRQGQIMAAIGDAMGLTGAFDTGRPGDPDSTDDWFVTDWMDTTRAQEALAFQQHSWPEMLAEMRANTGWKRYPLSLVRPVVKQFLNRRAAYRDAPGRYADPWGAIRATLGEPLVGIPAS
jgi:nucleoside-diphosphate-sugar epimerase